jgi:hypothetical protein
MVLETLVNTLPGRNKNKLLPIRNYYNAPIKQALILKKAPIIKSKPNFLTYTFF